MHRNLYFILLIGFIGFTAVWYSGTAIYRYSEYRHLDQRIQVEQIEWSVREQSSEYFLPAAKYRFWVQNVEFKGESLLSKPASKSSIGIEEALPELKKRDWFVWFDRLNPNKNSLEKFFPLKEVLSAAGLWVILLYFVGLGYYVARRNS